MMHAVSVCNLSCHYDAEVLAQPNLRAMVHDRDGSRMEFCGNTLLPLLVCVQKADESFASVLEVWRHT